LVREKSNKLSKFEFGLMEVFWSLGRASIREIHEQLPEKRRPAYTTVQTMVNRLEDKGAVRRVRKIGNAHIYEPTISRQAAHRRVIHDFLELFGGSAQPLMAHLLETGMLTLEDVRALEGAFGKTQGGSPSDKSNEKEGV